MGKDAWGEQATRTVAPTGGDNNAQVASDLQRSRRESRRLLVLLATALVGLLLAVAALLALQLWTVTHSKEHNVVLGARQEK